MAQVSVVGFPLFGLYQAKALRKRLPCLGKSIETADLEEGQQMLTKFQHCACAKILRRQTKSLRSNAWSLSWSESVTSHHLKTCQYWTPHQEAWTTNLSVFHVNFLVAKGLSASIRISKQVRIFSISPPLSLRGVVNESSPAFALLKELRTLCEIRPGARSYPSTQRLEKRTSLVARSILQLLRNEAVSPYEVDQNGRTLLHNALLCICSSYRRATL